MAIPKSLHTVTAVRNVAMYVRFEHPKRPAKDVVSEVFSILGYGGDREDPHGLRDACVAAVQRDIDSEDK